MKASGEQAATTAWHTRNLHYVKDLPSLDQYLNPPKPKSRDVSAAELRAMITRKAQKQGDARGTR